MTCGPEASLTLKVRQADELLLSAAGQEVLAITQPGGAPVGNGRTGPIYAARYAAYRQASGQDWCALRTPYRRNPHCEHPPPSRRRPVAPGVAH